MAVIKKKKSSSPDTAKKTSRAKKLSAEQLAKVLKPLGGKEEIAKLGGPIAALESAGITSPMIIVGAERLRIRRLIQWLKDNVFPARETSANSSYFGSELTSAKSLDGIITALTSPSLFNPCELVVVFDADKVRAAVAEPLIDALAGGTPAGFLILACESISTRTPLPNKLKSSATLIEIKELAGNKLERWIEKEAKLAGASGGIERAAIELLIASYGNDMLTLSQELSKLALLTTDDNRITKTVVEQIALKTPERKSFELINQMAWKNPINALGLTRDLLEQGLHPLQLSAFLSRALRTMLAHKSPRSSSPIPPSESSASELSNAWFLRSLSRAIGKFEFDDLVQCLEVTKTLDMQLKSSGMSDETVLATAVQRMTSRQFLPLP